MTNKDDDITRFVTEIIQIYKNFFEIAKINHNFIASCFIIFLSFKALQVNALSDKTTKR
jgi:hypothetical protein